jgi:hypothetical protein
VGDEPARPDAPWYRLAIITRASYITRQRIGGDGGTYLS